MTLDEAINNLRTKYPDTMDKVDKLLEEYKAAENEYVRRSDLLMAYDAQHKGKPGKARKLIADLPAADVRPVVRGEWIKRGQDIYCSNCNAESGYNPFGASSFSRYCPNCGADMKIGD